jgi:hypothetical protein
VDIPSRARTDGSTCPTSGHPPRRCVHPGERG